MSDLPKYYQQREQAVDSDEEKIDNKTRTYVEFECVLMRNAMMSGEFDSERTMRADCRYPKKLD